MAHTHTQGHAAQDDAGHGFDARVIWRTFWILLIVTCVELAVGMFVAPMFPHSTKIWFNILYIILTAVKAFYIIAEFMHLRHEIKNMIMSIALPSLLFIWLIGALIWDGDAFLNARRTHEPYQETREKIVAPAAPGHGHQHEHQEEHAEEPAK
jgi:cytochrome c oxidase subunit 4